MKKFDHSESIFVFAHGQWATNFVFFAALLSLLLKLLFILFLGLKQVNFLWKRTQYLLFKQYFTPFLQLEGLLSFQILLEFLNFSLNFLFPKLSNQLNRPKSLFSSVMLLNLQGVNAGKHRFLVDFTWLNLQTLINARFIAVPYTA